MNEGFLCRTLPSIIIMIVWSGIQSSDAEVG